MAKPREDTGLRASPADGRSAAACVSAGMPYHDYTWRGVPGPVIGKPNTDLTDEPARRRAERAGTYAVGPGTGWEPPDGDELAELAAERDRYAAAMALAGAPGPAPPPAPPAAAARRCSRCGYLTTSIGHKAACGD